MEENEEIEDVKKIKVKKKKKGKKKSQLGKKKTKEEAPADMTNKSSLKAHNKSAHLKLNEKHLKKSKKGNKEDKEEGSNNIIKLESMKSLKSTIKKTTEMIIKQEADVLEAVTGCQEPNNYNVYARQPNGDKVFIFKCKEFSGCAMRYFCPVSCRAFEMKIKMAFDEQKNDDEEEDYDSCYINIVKNCKLPCLCCVRPEMDIFMNENNQKLGTIEQGFSICDPVFRIYDSDKKEIFYIEADCCQCGFICRNNFIGKTDEAHFFIYDYNDRKEPIGDICKKGAKSNFSLGDNYYVALPPKSTFEERILLTIAGIMVDYQYFEMNTNAK